MWILNLYSAISWSISIALSTLVFRENYSLQTTPKKLLLQSDGSRRLSGSEFQAVGPPTAKARRPNVLVETAEQLGSDDWQISDAVDWRHPRLGCGSRPGTSVPCFEVYCVGYVCLCLRGLISAVGLSSLQHCDMGSSRNLFILGLSLFTGLAVPDWVAANQSTIQTGQHAVFLLSVNNN